MPTRIKERLLKQLYAQPEVAVEQLNLVYVNDAHLTIRRINKKKNFQYLRKGKPLTSAEELDRINQLTIPPAWKKVRISELANGHLQAVGRDLKNRKQYKYHSLWNKARNQTKFYRMLSFAKQLPKIRKQVHSDLNQAEWSKTKVIALVIRLIEETNIRIGNTKYANRNKTYGLSTMRTRHVSIEENKLRFEFVGKRGKKHRVTIRNKRLIKLVNQCEEIPGWELFQFFDARGNKHKIESGMINEYLQQVSGGAYTAKDFRTWAASMTFFERLMELGCTSTNQQQQENITQAFDAAAEALGNTRNVCKKYYVHPAIVASYIDESIQKAFNLANDSTLKEEFFSSLEFGALSLIKEYTPQFLNSNQE